MGTAPEGNRGKVAGTGIHRFADGKIVEGTLENYDALGIMQQLGVIPARE